MSSLIIIINSHLTSTQMKVQVLLALQDPDMFSSFTPPLTLELITVLITKIIAFIIFKIIFPTYVS